MTAMDFVRLVLTVVSGLCWTIVYIDAIRLGFRDKTYGIPLWALALNLAWEVFNSVLGYREAGLGVQVVINMIWATFDTLIVVCYFSFGYKYVRENMSRLYFNVWGLLVFAVAAIVEYAFIAEFGLAPGRAYAAFLQNLLMSVLFIAMLNERGSGEGQSLTIAVNKCVGTLAPTILLGVLGSSDLGGPNAFLLVLGLLCFLFDALYIAMLARLAAGRGALTFSPGGNRLAANLRGRA